MGAKMVVTGGAGFIGRSLVTALLDRGDAVHVIDIDREPYQPLDPRAIVHLFDIRNEEALRDLFQNVDTVFHLAAIADVQKSIDFPVESTNVNVGGTVAVLSAAATAHVRRVVFSSSSAVYGDQDQSLLVEGCKEKPKSPYGLQKLVGEEYARLWSDIYRVQTVSLRYFNVYGQGLNPHGPYARAIGRFLKQKSEGVPLTITGDGSQTRDFIYIDDVVSANLRASEAASVGKGEVINIGYGRGYSIADVARMIGGPTEFIPARIEPHDTLASIARAKELLGWEPHVSLEEGLDRLASRSMPRT